MGQLILQPFALVGERLGEALHDFSHQLVTLSNRPTRVVHKATLYVRPSCAVPGGGIRRKQCFQWLRLGRRPVGIL